MGEHQHAQADQRRYSTERRSQADTPHQGLVGNRQIKAPQPVMTASAWVAAIEYGVPG